MTRPHLPIPHLPLSHHAHNHGSHSTSPSEKSMMPTGRGGAGNMRACSRIDRAANEESTQVMAAVEEHMAEIDGYLCPPHQQPEDQQVLQRIHTEQLVQRQRSENGRSHPAGERRRSSLSTLIDLFNPQNAGRTDRKGSLVQTLKKLSTRRGSKSEDDHDAADEEVEQSRHSEDGASLTASSSGCSSRK